MSTQRGSTDLVVVERQQCDVRKVLLGKRHGIAQIVVVEDDFPQVDEMRDAYKADESLARATGATLTRNLTVERHQRVRREIDFRHVFRGELGNYLIGNLVGTVVVVQKLKKTKLVDKWLNLDSRLYPLLVGEVIADHLLRLHVVYHIQIMFLLRLA